ncbi:uncharacterized protein LOC131032791 isoform X2 [Cryptomeria japonica]|uniref:uncharacterized protein LOC131032791 isoform X2 n=1 Tax=Cryptomeria japonica TaxID=3369 RepID=UPI0027DA9680|nr:uncharacterized protein LOC131032791 isoform X2 [Cryptomeria japonica]
MDCSTRIYSSLLCAAGFYRHFPASSSTDHWVCQHDIKTIVTIAPSCSVAVGVALGIVSFLCELAILFVEIIGCEEARVCSESTVHFLPDLRIACFALVLHRIGLF